MLDRHEERSSAEASRAAVVRRRRPCLGVQLAGDQVDGPEHSALVDGGLAQPGRQRRAARSAVGPGQSDRSPARRPSCRVRDRSSPHGRLLGPGRDRHPVRSRRPRHRAGLHHAALGDPRGPAVSRRTHHPLPPCRRRRGAHGAGDHVQSGVVRLERRPLIARQRPASARRRVLGRQHRLCPRPPMDIDAVSTRLLGNAAGQRPACAAGPVLRGRARGGVDAARSCFCCFTAGSAAMRWPIGRSPW